MSSSVQSIVISALSGRSTASDYNKIISLLNQELLQPDLPLPTLIFLVKAGVYLNLLQNPQVSRHPLFIRQVRELARGQSSATVSSAYELDSTPDQATVDFELLSLATILQNLAEGVDTDGPFDMMLRESMKVLMSADMTVVEVKLMVEAQTYLSLVRDVRLRGLLVNEVMGLVEEIVGEFAGMGEERVMKLDKMIEAYSVESYLLPYHL